MWHSVGVSSHDTWVFFFSLVVRYIWGYVHVISCHDVSCLRIKSVFWCMSWCVNSGHVINLCLWKDFDVFIPFFIGELQTLTEGCCKSEDGNGTISAEELYQFLIGSIDALGFTAMLNSSGHPVLGDQLTVNIYIFIFYTISGYDFGWQTQFNPYDMGVFGKWAATPRSVIWHGKWYANKPEDLGVPHFQTNADVAVLADSVSCVAGKEFTPLKKAWHWINLGSGWDSGFVGIGTRG